MIIVSNSKVKCGACGLHLEVEWDLDLVQSYKQNEEVCCLYESEEKLVCSKCGNTIVAKLFVREYPIGVLDETSVAIMSDDSGKSVIEKPMIEMYDL